MNRRDALKLFGATAAAAGAAPAVRLAEGGGVEVLPRTTDETPEEEVTTMSALLKNDGYDSWSFDLGDTEIPPEAEAQLDCDRKELVAAVNAEGLAGKIFRRVLANRRSAFDRLVEKIPDVESG